MDKKDKPDENKVHLVPVTMTHNDWSYLHDISAAWNQFDSTDQLGRFESHSTSEKPLDSDFLVANWFGDNYANVILAKAYLEAMGHAWICLWDMAEANDAGDLMGYVLLTDYDAERYRHK